MSSCGYCSLGGCRGCGNHLTISERELQQHDWKSRNSDPEINGIVLFSEESIKGRSRGIEVSVKLVKLFYTASEVRRGQKSCETYQGSFT